MLTKIEVGPYSILGLSLGGVYTSLCIPELSVIFDVGIAPRSFVGASHLLISHGHADHVGALPSMIGVRGLAHQPAPLIYLPQEIAEDIEKGLLSFNRSQRRQLETHFIALLPGDEQKLSSDLYMRAYRTLHSVPSLGYHLFRKVKKLRPEFLELKPREIAERRQAGDDLFDTVERSEVAYFTDTLIDVLDRNPELYRARILILECTFLDDRKSKDESRLKSHIHLDEILDRAELFQNDHIVLMHFSQIYQPAEVHSILKRRLPSSLAQRVIPHAPVRGVWPG